MHWHTICLTMAALALSTVTVMAQAPAVPSPAPRPRDRASAPPPATHFWYYADGEWYLVRTSARSTRKHPAEEKGLKSLRCDVETSIRFVNRSKQTIKVYWLDYEGQRKLYDTVASGEVSEVQRTYLTHPWLITDENDNAWYVHFPDCQSRTVMIVAPEKK